MAERATRTPRLVTVAAVLLALLAIGVGALPAKADDTGVKIDIIDDGRPSPAPSSTSPASPSTGTPPGTGGGGSTPRPGGGTGSGAPSSPSTPGTEQPSPVTSVPGVRVPFVVSALTVTPSSTLAPFGGRVEVAVTVHNLSDESVEASAAVRLENLFGGRLASKTEAIRALAPGEKRLVRVEFDSLGQEGLVKLVAAVTPPVSIDGDDASPIRREAWAFVTPWILVAGLALVGLGVGAPFAIRRWGLM